MLLLLDFKSTEAAAFLMYRKVLPIFSFFDFTERFKNLDKVEPINRENLDKEISLSNNYDLSQYQDGNEKDNFIFDIMCFSLFR